jgi:hypothetical protein
MVSCYSFAGNLELSLITTLLGIGGETQLNEIGEVEDYSAHERLDAIKLTEPYPGREVNV